MTSSNSIQHNSKKKLRKKKERKKRWPLFCIYKKYSYRLYGKLMTGTFTGCKAFLL